MLRKKKSILISNGNTNRERKSPRRVFTFNGIQNSTSNPVAGDKSTKKLRTATSLAVPMEVTPNVNRTHHQRHTLFSNNGTPENQNGGSTINYDIEAIKLDRVRQAWPT